MDEKLIKKAADLLNEKKVDIIIGFEKHKNKIRPIFIKHPKDLEKLTLNEKQNGNLVSYLKKKDFRKKYKKIGIVARIPEIKALMVLSQENQINEDNIIILRPESLDKEKISDYELLIPELEKEYYEKNYKHLENEIKKLESMTQKERFEFWKKEFKKCIRCYACRQSCPLCYCTHCIVEKNQPQWIETSSHKRGNFSWHMIRALHEAGRCVACGACETACPVNIPLMLLNEKLLKEVLKHFGYKPGHKKDGKGAMADFKKEDKEDFIL